MRIVLIGMMGSGKSSVGEALARRTGWPFIDNDALVERATGHTARELAARRVDELRRAESAAMRAGLEVPPPAIVASAAGVVLDPADRAILASAAGVVWLRARPATLVARLHQTDDDHRPWLDTDPEAWLRETDAERAPLYAAVADVIVDVDERTPDEIGAAIAVELGGGLVS